MKHVISLDIGGTNIRAAIINENYEIIAVVKERTITHSLDKFLAQVIDVIKRLEYKRFDPKVIGIGVPGRVRKNGFIDALPNIYLLNIPLAEYVSNHFNLPVYVKNDAEMAGLCEAVVGAGKNYNNVYFVTISTGVGAAFVENKRLKQLLDEPGHTLIKYKDELYEFEHLASGNGLLLLAKLNGIEISSAAEFFERVKANDKTVLPLYHEWLTLISNFFNELIEFFEPEIFVLSGGVMYSRDVFLDDLKQRVENAKITTAGFSQDAGLIGAAVYAFQNA